MLARTADSSRVLSNWCAAFSMEILAECEAAAASATRYGHYCGAHVERGRKLKGVRKVQR